MRAVVTAGLSGAMLAWALLGGLSPAMAGTRDRVRIFSLQKPDRDWRDALPELANPLVAGISWRFRWKTLEPQDGQYRWDAVDRAIEVTRRAGKQVMLRVVSGIHTPAWVYEAGARPFDFGNADLRHGANYARTLRMPIPWDAVYLDAWTRFIRAFGDRYQGHPAIYSIQMAGGGHIAEMNLPKAIARWRQVGYRDDRLIAAWKRIIDTYQRAFPKLPTNLNINEPLGRNRSHVLDPVVHYVLGRYPGKVYLQQDGLRAHFPRDSRIRRLLRAASSRTVVGYQMVGGRGFLDARAGDRLTAFRHARDDGAGYVEVYARDVRDPGLQPALRVLAGPPAAP